MALVLALGLGGVVYAGWTDTVTIDGTVQTGDVDITVEKYSGTYVWKTDNVSADEIFVESGWMADIGDPASVQGLPMGTNIVDAFPNYVASPDPGSAGVDPVGFATAACKADDEITVTFDNMFPCVDFTADFLLHYAGSIPVKVNVLNLGWDCAKTDDELEDNSTLTIEYYESNAAGAMIGSPLQLAAMQLHECDYILVVITIHLTQMQDNMLKSGELTGTIGVKQWNEVP